MSRYQLWPLPARIAYTYLLPLIILLCCFYWPYTTVSDACSSDPAPSRTITYDGPDDGSYSSTYSNRYSAGPIGSSYREKPHALSCFDGVARGLAELVGGVIAGAFFLWLWFVARRGLKANGNL